VKIRGFRIELGEIESVLGGFPGVREAVVIARQDRKDERYLAAYVVPAAAATLAVPELRAFLRERLPDSMVPATFTLLDELPLTPNRKVDRKALPAPQWQDASKAYVAPRTPVEEVLAGIWAELLGRERVGATDHFFELGGHSLLATRVMSRLRGAFGVEMPLRDLFTAPRLADLAARIEAARFQIDRTGTATSAPPLLPVPGDGPRPLSFAQQRLWFIDQLEPGSSAYNIPMALRVEGPLEGAMLARCLGEIVRRHEALRTVFAVQESSPVQVIQGVAPFALPMVDLSGRPPIRSRARPPAARRAVAAGRAGPRHRVDDPPHRERRLVDGHPDPRDFGPLCGVCRRRAFSFAGAPGAVCGLCGVATAKAPGRGARGPALLVARKARGCAGGPRTTCRPAAPGSAALPR
jgi:acyl carrier protein